MAFILLVCWSFVGGWQYPNVNSFLRVRTLEWFRSYNAAMLFRLVLFSLRNLSFMFRFLLL